MEIFRFLFQTLQLYKEKMILWQNILFYFYFSQFDKILHPTKHWVVVVVVVVQLDLYGCKKHILSIWGVYACIITHWNWDLLLPNQDP